jgi:dTDP-4-dehydrorhamnose reductase
MGSAPNRILVLGGTGMLGHEAIRVLGEEHDMHASVRDPAAARGHGLNAELHAFDAGRPDRLPALLEASGAEVALNCIGIVKQLPEGSQPIPSIAINSLFPHQLAAACAERGVRLIHVSTDCVFSGELAPPAAYTEAHAPDARDLYGRSKLLGEVSEGAALTLRTSIIGWELERALGLLEWLASQAGNPIRGFANAHFSGLTTHALARVVGEVVRDHPELGGLYQVSSEPISKYALVSELGEALGLGCTVERVDEPHVNRVLDSSRFRAETGIESPAWSEMIAELARERSLEPQPR